MRLLLDTHVFLWAVAGSRLLKPSARQLIATADEVFVSAASLWEITIKVGIGRLDVDPAELALAIEASGFTELPVRTAHTVGIAALSSHHDDPFDRLLIAQAQSEPLRLLTADPVLRRYSELVVLV